MLTDFLAGGFLRFVEDGFRLFALGLFGCCCALLGVSGLLGPDDTNALEADFKFDFSPGVGARLRLPL